MIPLEYMIHDNGGRPFKVKIEGLEISVFKEDEDNNGLYTNLVYNKICESIWVGKSPIIPMTELSEGHGQEFDGNTILVNPCDSDSYVFIGSTIESFVPLHPIVDFVSPVGHNDIPYPFAIDSHQNCYLFTEHVIVKNCVNNENPYDDFYKIANLSDSLNPFVFHSKLIKALGMGEHVLILAYSPFPEKDYDRLASSLGYPFLIYDDDTTEQLSKEIYCELMESFELEKNLQPLETFASSLIS